MIECATVCESAISTKNFDGVHSMRVVVAVVVRDDSANVEFAVAILALMNALESAPGVEVHIHFVPDEKAVFSLTPTTKDAVLVFLRSTIGFPVELILRAIASQTPVVVGIHPLPVIQWSNIKPATGGAVSVEELRSRASVFNVDPSSLEHEGGGYVKTKHVREVGVAVFKAPTFPMLRTSTTAVQACKAWVNDGGYVFADMDHQCSSFGPVGFEGCVGFRNVIR